MTFYEIAEKQYIQHTESISKVSKNAIFGPNLLPVIWTS